MARTVESLLTQQIGSLVLQVNALIAENDVLKEKLATALQPAAADAAKPASPGEVAAVT
jgi:hypothetical protein